MTIFFLPIYINKDVQRVRAPTPDKVTLNRMFMAYPLKKVGFSPWICLVVYFFQSFVRVEIILIDVCRSNIQITPILHHYRAELLHKEKKGTVSTRTWIALCCAAFSGYLAVRKIPVKIIVFFIRKQSQSEANILLFIRSHMYMWKANLTWHINFCFYQSL